MGKIVAGIFITLLIIVITLFVGILGGPAGLSGAVSLLFVGLIPAFIAKSTGRNFFVWWIYGIVLFIIALIHSIWIKYQWYVEKNMKKCPYCAELIMKEAIVCVRCGNRI